MIRMACGGITGSTISTPLNTPHTFNSSVGSPEQPPCRQTRKKRGVFFLWLCRIEPLVCGSVWACFGSIASAICLTLALLPGIPSDWGAPLTASSGMRSFFPPPLFIRCFVTQSIMYYFNHQPLAKHNTHGIAVPRRNSGKFFKAFYIFSGRTISSGFTRASKYSKRGRLII